MTETCHQTSEKHNEKQQGQEPGSHTNPDRSPICCEKTRRRTVASRIYPIFPISNPDRCGATSPATSGRRKKNVPKTTRPNQTCWQKENMCPRTKRMRQESLIRYPDFLPSSSVSLPAIVVTISDTVTGEVSVTSTGTRVL